MGIFRGIGGTGNSTDDGVVDAVTAQAVIATNKATEAATSATSAYNSAQSASTSKDTATTQANAAQSSANTASTHATNAATSETNAATSASNAQSARNEIVSLTASTGAAGTNASYDASTGVLTVPRGDTGAQGDAFTYSDFTQSQLNALKGGSANLASDSMTGDGSTTTLTLSVNPTVEDNTQVYIDGVYQNKTTYSVSGTTLTFSTAPPSGSAVEVIIITPAEGITLSVTTDTANTANTVVQRDSNGDFSAGTITADLNGLVGGRNVATDGSKLDGIETGADVTATANVTSAGALMDSECASLADVKALDQSVVSGASPTFSTANFTDASDKRFMTDAQENKLDSIEQSADVTDTANVVASLTSGTNINIANDGTVSTSATANDSDTNLKNRANHTGNQSISTVTGLQTALDAKEPTITKNTAFNKSFGTASGTVTEGNDSRLSDSRTCNNNFDNATTAKTNLSLENVENKSSATIRSEIVESDIPASITRDSELTLGLSSKVDTVSGKGLSANDFTNTLKSKLDSIDSNATVDQTPSEIKTAYESNADTNAFTDSEKSKLSGIESSADVTDTTNVVASLTSGTNISIANDGTVSTTATQAINASSLGASSDNTVDMGTSSSRFKDIYLSGGVYIGGTGSSNLLNDYEQGTWTPTVYASNGTSTLTAGTHYVLRDASYTKIGRLVFISIKIEDIRSAKTNIWFTPPFNSSVTDTSVGATLGAELSGQSIQAPIYALANKFQMRKGTWQYAYGSATYQT